MGATARRVAWVHGFSRRRIWAAPEQRLTVTTEASTRDTPNRRRYLVSNAAGYLFPRTLDAIASLTPSTAREAPTTIRRIVIGVGGHLGDAIIATAVLPAIRHASPDVEI